MENGFLNNNMLTLVLGSLNLIMKVANDQDMILNVLVKVHLTWFGGFTRHVYGRY